jgi:hypothetical protein
MWTETHQKISFLDIILHYLEGSTMKTVNLCVHRLEKRHTAENISEIFKWSGRRSPTNNSVDKTPGPPETDASAIWKHANEQVAIF